MLSHIDIKNYAITKELHLELHPGFSVLTGETGAGKSIIVDAVNLALGARVDHHVVKTGEKQCDISLSFDLQNIPTAINWLIENNLDEDNECIIRRIIQQEGKTRSTINGHPCPQSLIREFKQLVLNIHSQHQHQALLKRDYQQHKLDEYAGAIKTVEKITTHYQQYKTINSRLTEFKNKSRERDERLQYLQYQLTELEELALKDNEWDELGIEHSKVHNAKKIIGHLNQALDLTVENERHSAILFLHQAIENLQHVGSDDQQISGVLELLNTAVIHLEEAGDELKHYGEGFDLSPEHLNTIETRLSLIHDIARKHHVEPKELVSVQESLHKQINDLNNIDDEIHTLEQQSNDILKQYQLDADKLSKLRKTAANKLNKAITDYMQKLGMQGGQFKITFEKTQNDIDLNGHEKNIFYVSTNPGQPLEPMNKVVSGGELSRISLALQALTSQKHNMPTLIFDEVDVGIGGQTANIVGSLLKSLGDNTQVFCITHLPQVASVAKHHYHVEKIREKNTAHSVITKLNETDRVTELAHMLGGDKNHHESINHAKALIASS